MVYKICGALMMALGFPLFLTPIPFGAVLIAAGLSIYIANSHRSQAHVRLLRHRHHWLDKMLDTACRFAPGPVSQILGRTACHHAPSCDKDVKAQ